MKHNLHLGQINGVGNSLKFAVSVQTRLAEFPWELCNNQPLLQRVKTNSCES
jgi:hypothetical protein